MKLSPSDGLDFRNSRPLQSLFVVQTNKMMDARTNKAPRAALKSETKLFGLLLGKILYESPALLGQTMMEGSWRIFGDFMTENFEQTETFSPASVDDGRVNKSFMRRSTPARLFDRANDGTKRKVLSNFVAE
jgi:hypothetical protein